MLRNIQAAITAKTIADINHLDILANIADDAALALSVRNALRDNARNFVPAIGFTNDDAHNRGILNDAEAGTVRTDAIRKRNELRIALVKAAISRLNQVNHPALTALTGAAITEADIRNALLNTPDHKTAFGLAAVANLNDMPLIDLAEIRQAAINRVNELKVKNAITQMNAVNPALTELATVALPGNDAGDSTAICNVLTGANRAQLGDAANPEHIPVQILKNLRQFAITKDKELKVKAAIRAATLGTPAVDSVVALSKVVLSGNPVADAPEIRRVLTNGAHHAHLGNLANADDLTIEQLREIHQVAVDKAFELRKNAVIADIRAIADTAANIGLLRGVIDANPRNVQAARTAIAALITTPAIAGPNGNKLLTDASLEDIRDAAFARLAVLRPAEAQPDHYRLANLRELLNSAPSQNEIVAALTQLNANPNLLLAGTDDYLKNTLTKLQQVAGNPARNAELAPTIRSAKIALELHLLQPLRYVLNEYVNRAPLPTRDRLVIEVQPLINRIKAANGLTADHALRQPLTTLETIINTAATTPDQAANAARAFLKELAKSQLSVLRRTLELTDESRNAALPDVIDQLLMPHSGLPAGHALRQPGSLTRLKTVLTNEYRAANQALNDALAANPQVPEDVAAARADLNTANVEIKRILKTVKIAVASSHGTDRQERIDQQRAGFSQATSNTIGASVDNQFLTYTERATLLADRAKSVRHSRIRDELLPVLTREAEELKQQFHVYQPKLQTRIDEHLAAQKFTLGQQELLTRLRTALTKPAGHVFTRNDVTAINAVLPSVLAAAHPGSPLHNALSTLNASVTAVLQPGVAYPLAPAIAAAFTTDVDNSLTAVFTAQHQYLLGKLRTALQDVTEYPAMHEANNLDRLRQIFLLGDLRTGPHAVTDATILAHLNNLDNQINTRVAQLAALAPPTAPIQAAMLDQLNQIANGLPPERTEEENEIDVQQWQRTRNSQTRRMTQTTEAITKLDTVLAKTDRVDMKPLKVLNFSNTCELVAKDQAQQKIQELINPNPQNPNMGLRAGGHNKSAVFNDNQALISSTVIKTGFGPTSKAMTVVSEQSNVNGRHVSKIHFNPADLKNSLFSGIDGYTKWAVTEIQNFLAATSNPNKPIAMYGNLPKNLVREMLTYCELKGINYVNHTEHHFTVSEKDKQNQSERISKLFPNHPDFATGTAKEEEFKQNTKLRV